MDFEQYALARDFLYLGALFFGAGTGFILRRFRNAAVTAGLCLFSGTLAALCAASIISNWRIFAETALYLPLGILALVLAVAVRFPRATGFPLILISGAFVVWMGYACLRYPVIGDNGLGQVTRDGENYIHARLPSDMSGSSLSFHNADEDAVMEFRAFIVSVSRYFPLAGGRSRGVITEISYNNRLLYAESRLGTKIIFSGYFSPGADTEFPVHFIAFHEAAGMLETGKLFPGAGRTICFDGSGLAFR